MNIPAEKLAQITAGADPKDVLTEEELQFYTAQLEEDTTAAEENEEVAGEGADAVEAPEATASDTSELLAMAKQIGQLEAQLEAANGRNEKLEAKLLDKDSEITGLAEVAKGAVANLCGALGKPKEGPASASAIVAKFTELQGEMSTRFPVGRKSQTNIEDPEVSHRAGSFRHNV